MGTFWQDRQEQQRIEKLERGVCYLERQAKKYRAQAEAAKLIAQALTLQAEAADVEAAQYRLRLEGADPQEIEKLDADYYARSSASWSLRAKARDLEEEFEDD